MLIRNVHLQRRQGQPPYPGQGLHRSQVPRLRRRQAERGSRGVPVPGGRPVPALFYRAAAVSHSITVILFQPVLQVAPGRPGLSHCSALFCNGPLAAFAPRLLIKCPPLRAGASWPGLHKGRKCYTLFNSPPTWRQLAPSCKARCTPRPPGSRPFFRCNGCNGGQLPGPVGLHRPAIAIHRN